MIAFANTGVRFKGAISYVLKEHEKNLTIEKMPEIIEVNKIWGTSAQMAKQMHFISELNTKSSRPVLHVAFSFHKEEKLSREKQLEAIHLALKEIAFDRDKNQYILVKHNDTDIEHYHLVINKVNEIGDNLSTGFIKNRLQVACDKVEKQMGLRYTKGRTVVYDAENNKGYSYVKKEVPKNKKFIEKTANISDTKQYIHDQLKEVLCYLKEINDLEKELKKRGIECKTTYNKNGLSGISFHYNNQAYKGSLIGFKAKDIVNRVIENKSNDYHEQKSELINFNKRIKLCLTAIQKDYEKGNLYPDFKQHFKNQNILYADGYIQYKSFRIKSDQIERFKSDSEVQVSNAIENHKSKLFTYQKLMKAVPKEIPWLIDRKKVLAYNKQLLFDQAHAKEPTLIIKLNQSEIPDYTLSIMNKIEENDQIEKQSEQIQQNESLNDLLNIFSVIGSENEGDSKQKRKR